MVSVALVVKMIAKDETKAGLPALRSARDERRVYRPAPDADVAKSVGSA